MNTTEKLYIVKDTEGHFISKFYTYNEAYGFKMLANRPDWIISKQREYKRKSTDKMKSAVAFVESITPYSFEGDIEDFNEVSLFLSNYLDYAKEKEREREEITINCPYYSEDEDELEEIYYDNMGYDDWRG